MTIKLVSEQDKEAVDAARTKIMISSALRELYANCLRIAAGDGNPERLPYQSIDLAKAMAELKGPLGELESVARDALDSRRNYRSNRPWVEKWNDSAIDLAHDAIRLASLKVEASLLLNQLPQLSKAETRFMNALWQREAALTKTERAPKSFTQLRADRAQAAASAQRARATANELKQSKRKKAPIIL